MYRRRPRVVQSQIMPLVEATLAADLEALFADPPPTESECAGEWASAFESYASTIFPTSSTVSIAAATLRGALSGFNGDTQLASKLASALTGFAGTIAGGMAPAFAGTPPASPLSLTFSNHDTPRAAAQAIASAVQTWMITGTATPIPSGPPVLWS